LVLGASVAIIAILSQPKNAANYQN